MDMDHKRIVITGATGFIGSNLARLFLEKGTEVVVLVRPGSVHMEALPSHERLRIVPCALEHVLDYVKEHKEEIGPAEGFFHLAWGGVNREEIDSPEVPGPQCGGFPGLRKGGPSPAMLCFYGCRLQGRVWGSGRTDEGGAGVPSHKPVRESETGILPEGRALMQNPWDGLLPSAFFQRIRLWRPPMVHYLHPGP